MKCTRTLCWPTSLSHAPHSLTRWSFSEYRWHNTTDSQPEDDPLVCVGCIAFRLGVSLDCLKIAHFLRWTIDSLLDKTFFDSRSSLTDEDADALTTLAERWKGHVAAGRFRLSIPTDTPLGADVPAANFWCTQYAYQDLPAVDPDLLAELQKAGLVVFKGDLKSVTCYRTTCLKLMTATANSSGMPSGPQRHPLKPRSVSLPTKNVRVTSG